LLLTSGLPIDHGAGRTLLVASGEAVFATLLVTAFAGLPVIPILAWFAHLPRLPIFAWLPVFTRLAQFTGFPIIAGCIAQRAGLAIITVLTWFTGFSQFTRFAWGIITIFARLAGSIGSRFAAISVFPLAGFTRWRDGLVGTWLAGGYARGKRCGGSNRFGVRFSRCLHCTLWSEGNGCVSSYGINSIGSYVSVAGAVNAIALTALWALI
jgi:hypothetical protein